MGKNLSLERIREGLTETGKMGFEGWARACQLDKDEKRLGKGMVIPFRGMECAKAEVGEWPDCPSAESGGAGK